ncbi:iron-containing redox enzyme family protein [Nocardioides pantholopis]|uniref:iron-containing redox enzyme family protein n=1 Tax=Nocardioides pantholopis TaxID=2483798 RepID=UPI001F15344A|nr:iron-containing redox enzyme family protein [Nocardioides pantholopis]
MLTPKARGAFSAAVFEAMRSGEGRVADVAPESPDDAAIALWGLFELHYRGFEDVDDDLEWHPGLLAVRHELATDLERRLRERWTPYAVSGSTAAEVGAELFAYIEDHDGPSLARYVHTTAETDQVLDLLRWRSVYHLKEADPTSWVVPRLTARPKAALMELQFDEYGNGDPAQLHHRLWERGMEGVGLRSEYGAYVDEAPLEALEQNNAMSLFGLSRKLRGAALGHLAAFEATSSLPSRKMAQGLDRLGMDAALIGYYTEHVEADAVHEQLAARDICGVLVEEEPALGEDVFFGAFTCLDLEDRFAHHVLGLWGADA